MSAFFSSVSTINIGPQETKTVDIYFLPFSVGDRQCSVIFLNESIGEFLYSIEAKSTLPLPAPIPFVKSQYNVVKPKIELGLSFIVSILVHKIQKIYL
jgi:hypothetical protein